MSGNPWRHRGASLMVWVALAGASSASSLVAAQADARVAKPTLLRVAPPSQTDYSITTTITPAEHVGPCPAKVAFVATITAQKAGPVQYRLRTSDNAYDPVRKLMFTAPGTKSFAVTRSLPPPGSSWAYFELVGPVIAASEMAYYDVQCTTDSSSLSKSRSSSAPAVGQPVTEAMVQPGILVAKPDLVITGVSGSHVKGDGAPGTLVWKFLVEIKNNGLTEAGGSFLCAHENPALAPQASKNPVPKLGHQQSAKIEYWYGKPSWAFIENGERTKRPLIFVADCQSSVDEGSEANDRYSVWLYWDPTEAKTWEPAQ